LSAYVIEETTSEDVKSLKVKYLESLLAPIDGMWSTFVEMADHYAVKLGENIIGYCSINSEQKILQFYVEQDHDDIYAQILKELDVKGAIVATNELQHLSLAMDHQASVVVNAHLFQCADDVELKEAIFSDGLIFRNVNMAELQTAIDFAVEAIGAPEEWLHGYYSERINSGELIGLWNGEQLIATGECRPSANQKPYADLGMVVSADYRKKGLATEILREMLHDCRKRGLKPICSTECENIGARKAIANAGFTSQMRILDLSFGNSI